MLPQLSEWQLWRKLLELFLFTCFFPGPLIILRYIWILSHHQIVIFHYEIGRTPQQSRRNTNHTNQISSVEVTSFGLHICLWHKACQSVCLTSVLTQESYLHVVKYNNLSRKC